MRHVTRRSVIFSALFSAALLGVHLDALAQRIDEATYQYPYKDPYLATMTVGIMKGDEDFSADDIRDIEIGILAYRNNIHLLEGKGKLHFRFYQQNGPAPVIFILPGLGGSAYTGSTRYIAELFVEKGFHVLALPNPYNWNFALAASTSGFPGLTREDSKDLYSVMWLALNHVKERYHAKIGKVGLIGLSDGALYAAYVSTLDSKQRRIGFDTTLLVNPPVDLLEAIRKIDDMAGLGKDLGEKQKENIESYAVGVGIDALKKDFTDPDYFANWDRRLRLTDKQMQYLIGTTLYAAVGDAIYVIDLLNDLTVLKKPISWGYRSARLKEARSMGLTGYLEEFLIPRLQQITGKRTNLERLNVRISLKGIESALQENKDIFLMHNLDDFLASKASLVYLENLFGDRATIYPLGGHLGNLWYPQNKSDIAARFEHLLHASPN